MSKTPKTTITQIVEEPQPLLDAQKLKDVLLELNGHLMFNMSPVKKTFVLRTILGAFGLKEDAINRIQKQSIHEMNRSQPLTIKLHKKTPEDALLNIDDFAMIPPTAKYFARNLAEKIAHIKGLSKVEIEAVLDICEADIHATFRSAAEYCLATHKADRQRPLITSSIPPPAKTRRKDHTNFQGRSAWAARCGRE